jgi:hypothetical protein
MGVVCAERRPRVPSVARDDQLRAQQARASLGPVAGSAGQLRRIAEHAPLFGGVENAPCGAGVATASAAISVP